MRHVILDCQDRLVWFPSRMACSSLGAGGFDSSLTAGRLIWVCTVAAAVGPAAVSSSESEVSVEPRISRCSSESELAGEATVEPRTSRFSSMAAPSSSSSCRSTRIHAFISRSSSSAAGSPETAAVGVLMSVFWTIDGSSLFSLLGTAGLTVHALPLVALALVVEG